MEFTLNAAQIAAVQKERDEILKVMDAKALDPNSKEYKELFATFNAMERVLQEWAKIESKKEETELQSRELSIKERESVKTIERADSEVAIKNQEMNLKARELDLKEKELNNAVGKGLKELDLKEKEINANIFTTIFGGVVKVFCTIGAIFATLVACGLDENHVAVHSAMNIADKFTKNL